MIPTNQQEILRKLASICELSPSVRLGQLMAHLDFLAQDMFDCGLGDIEDGQLMRVMERHEAELAQRQSNVA
jgi:hypothetical protein